MPTYQEVIEELGQHGITATDSDFYDFVDFPLEEDFERFFNYCQEYLDRDDLGYNIRPARFFYNTRTSLNACARTEVNGYGLVEIWKGSLFELNDLFLAKEERFDAQPFQRYRALTQQRAGITPSYFLFQMATLFFLYHETGHLIQRGGPMGNNLEFAGHECIGGQVGIQHMRELDADAFACHCLAMHAIQFSEENTTGGITVNPQALNDAAALALAAVYIFFIHLSDGDPAIYLEEKCHPHPLVRLCYCVIFLLQNIQKNVGVQIPQPEILTSAIRISEHLMREPGSNIVEDFSLAISGQINQIEDYINQIIANARNYPHLTVNILPLNP
jgi:hypothetical protein